MTFISSVRATAPGRPRKTLARIILYEVAEAVRFEPGDDGGEPVWMRKADATLLGKTVVPLGADPVFTSGTFVTARASSIVPMPGGEGAIACAFDLLMDSDPARPLLDKLLVTSSGTLDGRLDLRESVHGFACADGQWSLPERDGTFGATFLLPMRRPDHDGFWYVAHDEDGGVHDAEAGGWQALAPDEFVLGIPVTKVVLTVFAQEPA